MSRDAEADMRKIQTLRQRVKDAERDAAGARVHHEQAEADLEQAKKAARDLEIDPENLKAFERWLDTESAAIEDLLLKAETNLAQAQEAIDGN